MGVRRKQRVKLSYERAWCISMRDSMSPKWLIWDAGLGGRLAGDEAGKVAWSQIVKVPVNQAKEAGL